MIDYFAFIEDVGKELSNHDLPDSLTYLMLAHQGKSKEHEFEKDFITAQGDNANVLTLVAYFLDEFAQRAGRPVSDVLDILAKILDVYVPEDQRGVQWDPEDEDPEAR